MKKVVLLFVCFLLNSELLAAKYFIAADASQPLSQPIEGLDDDGFERFILGRSFFVIPWVAAPSSTTARDGLGPLFNANTCKSCHVDNNAANILSNNGEPLRGLVFKLSQPEKHYLKPIHQGFVADPTYGAQIAINGVANVVPEAKPALEIKTKTIKLEDGEALQLSQFTPHLEDLAYGPLHQNTRISLRQAPALVGLGLIEKIPAPAIIAQADPADNNNDGISGRVNKVYDKRLKKTLLGRFGYKASQPSVLAQTADAAAHDMGLTNPYFVNELCGDAQEACQRAPKGRISSLGQLDLPMPRLQAIAFYLQNLKAPKPKKLSEQAKKGQEIFTKLGCQQCHRESWQTSDGISFKPYSDFLLHGMGAALSDNRPEYLATASEWRTAPLWGLGFKLRKRKRLLHDGRAASIPEAIVWHGGEAATHAKAYKQLSKIERNYLSVFLESL